MAGNPGNVPMRTSQSRRSGEDVVGSFRRSPPECDLRCQKVRQCQDRLNFPSSHHLESLDVVFRRALNWFRTHLAEMEMFRASAREELERRWHARLKGAGMRLEFTRTFLTELHQNSEGDALVPVDSSDIAEALRAESAALQEYTRTLRIYTDLVLDGKIPDKDCDAASSGHD